MLFRTAASVALLACSASASADPRPYKLAMMPVLGQSLSRRDTLGYQPEETICGDGTTCAEACGEGYAQCPSNDAAVHCFNPEAAQNCCSDGTGNSCEADYYCTHDSQLQTWCCPDSMDLAECAAAYSVTGGLETPAPTTSTPTSTPSSTPSTTPVSTPCSTPIYSTSWSGSNSTITTSTPTYTPAPPAETTPPAEPSPQPTAGAPASGVSFAFLLAGIGAAALF